MIVGSEETNHIDSISFLTNLPYELFETEMENSK
jgi:hypothetical protein